MDAPVGTIVLSIPIYIHRIEVGITSKVVNESILMNLFIYSYLIHLSNNAVYTKFQIKS